VLGPDVLCRAHGDLRRDDRHQLQPGGAVPAGPPHLGQRRHRPPLAAAQHGKWVPGSQHPFERRDSWHEFCGVSKSRVLFVGQVVCPYAATSGVHINFLLYMMARQDQGPGWSSANGQSGVSNMGLAVARNNAPGSGCPALRQCLFVDASPIRSEIGHYWDFQYALAVGFTMEEPPLDVAVYLVDEPLDRLCKSPGDDFSWATRGYFTFSPSSARDMWSSWSTVMTRVMLQLTRRRGLVTGWGWWARTRDRNLYRAELPSPLGSDNSTFFESTSWADAYPVVGPGEVASTRARWADEAYRNSTILPRMEEFWRDNGTNSYYFHLRVKQFSEVVTYTQHDPVDPVALLGIYGTVGAG
jgi:hypothetical protein